MIQCGSFTTLISNSITAPPGIISSDNSLCPSLPSITNPQILASLTSWVEQFPKDRRKSSLVLETTHSARCHWDLALHPTTYPCSLRTTLLSRDTVSLARACRDPVTPDACSGSLLGERDFCKLAGRVSPATPSPPHCHSEEIRDHTKSNSKGRYRGWIIVGLHGAKQVLTGWQRVGSHNKDTLVLALLPLAGASNLELQCSHLGHHQECTVWMKVLDAFFLPYVMPRFDSHMDI